MSTISLKNFYPRSACAIEFSSSFVLLLWLSGIFETRSSSFSLYFVSAFWMTFSPSLVIITQQTRASSDDVFFRTYPLLSSRFTIRVAPLFVKPRAIPISRTGQFWVFDILSRAMNSGIDISSQHSPFRPIGPKCHTISIKDLLSFDILTELFFILSGYTLYPPYRMCN